MDIKEKKSIIAKDLLEFGISMNKIKKLFKPDYIEIIENTSVEELKETLTRKIDSNPVKDFISNQKILREIYNLKVERQLEKERHRNALDSFNSQKEYYQELILQIEKDNLVDENGFVTEGKYKNCKLDVIKNAFSNLNKNEIYYPSYYEVDSKMSPREPWSHPYDSDTIFKYPIPCNLINQTINEISAEGLYLRMRWETNENIRKYFPKPQRSETNFMLLVKVIDFDLLWEMTDDKFKKDYNSFIKYLENN